MQTIIFDMDGILFDTERISNRICYQTAEKMKLGNIEEAVAGSMGRSMADSTQLFKELYGEQFPVKEFWEMAISAYHKELEKNALPLMRGVVSLLHYLKENKYVVGLASSTSRDVILRHLKRSELTEYFQIVVGGDQVKHSKPHPDIYALVCREIGSNPKDTIAVEDSPNGIKSAYAAGLKPIMIPDLIQPDDELKKLLYRQYTSLEELEEAVKTGKIENII